LASTDLIDLAKQNPAAVEKYTVKQIVGICGDGSECSKHLREFLALQSSDRLAEYAHFCLDEGFNKSGFVLQDIVNEIGRRLGYQVQSGRYQGIPNQAGFEKIAAQQHIGPWVIWILSEFMNYRLRPLIGGATAVTPGPTAEAAKLDFNAPGART
jgi:hypothetical protein